MSKSENARILALERSVIRAARGGRVRESVQSARTRLGLGSDYLAIRAVVAEIAAELLQYHESVADDIREDLEQFRRFDREV